MAPKPVCPSLPLLWALALFVHGATSLCNVTCWTDYEVSLNCSCSGFVPAHPVQLQVICSDFEDEVNGSCEVQSSQSWCTMEIADLYKVASIGNLCTASVIQRGDEEIVKANEPSTWALSDVVKPQPPFNVRVTYVDGFYNVSWDNNNDNKLFGCLTYRVRIRKSKDLSKDPVHSLLVESQSIVLEDETLQQRFSYTVDVQAKMCPGNCFKGTTGYWWCVSLPIVLVVGLLFMGYLQKPFWQKRIRVITNIPKADDFFKPLYHSYGGNFKEWVKPLFSEYDYLRINLPVPMMSEKQHDVLHWNNKKQIFCEDSETTQGGHFLHMLQPHGNLLLHLQDGGSSQGTGHSTGHISIHTVTLSGQEFEQEVMSQSSVNTVRSYQDGGSFGSFERDNRERAGYNIGEPQLSQMDIQSVMLQQLGNQRANHLLLENVNFEPHAQFNEPERISLDSFTSNEQSEDGYPHVDLDTFDSGFAECSSPGVSHSNTAEQMDSDLFQEHKHSNSNYVKQWMICGVIQEDSSSEHELHETQ